LTWGRVASLALDPVEKKPLYHFQPGSRTLSLGTLGCNLRCLHCQNASLSWADAALQLESLEAVDPAGLVALARERGCRSLVFTYNEPLVGLESVLEAAAVARGAGLATVVVTAGAFHAEPLARLFPVLDAYRLDVKAFSDKVYQALCGGSFLDAVLAGGEAAAAAGCHVEIVTNLIPGYNDDEEQLSGIAGWIAEHLHPETPWHLTAYHPAFRLTAPATPLSTIEKALAIGRRAGLRHCYAGNIGSHPSDTTLCPDCGTALIRRNGFSLVENHALDGTCPACGRKLAVFVP
jgi:pyruvate formate lyase activating enzyme